MCATYLYVHSVRTSAFNLIRYQPGCSAVQQSASVLLRTSGFSSYRSYLTISFTASHCLLTMEQRDRDRINVCCENVVSKIDMTKLLPQLLENRVYNRDDANMVRWKDTITILDTVRDIYLTVKTRGPYAFEKLLLSLRQSDHGNVADILQGKTNANNISLHQEYNLNGSIWSDKPLIIKVRKATEFLDRGYDIIERYPMRSKPRGIVLIISNIYYYASKPRLSAENDKKNLRKLFEEMGFKVIVHENLKGSEIKKVMKEFSKSDGLNKVNSCFVIVTSHGTEDQNAEDKENNTEIQGIDYSSASRQADEKVLCADLCDYFTAEACPQLAEKPKIFIFQLCRGHKKQKAVAHSRTTTDSSSFLNTDYEQSAAGSRFRLTTRNYSDMLIVYSTLPGHLSYRDNINGSWFIYYLCDVFMKYACTTHVLDMLNMVDACLKQIRTGNDECQTSCIQSWGFNKHLYLNPGLFEK